MTTTLIEEERTTSPTTTTTAREGDLNPDPITGQPGSHPVGTGVGAAGGAVAGAAIGAVGGPVGAAVGGAIGAIVGGAAGHSVAERIDPTVEDAYWREHHVARGDADPSSDYERDYRPAYRHGWEAGATRREGDWNPSLENDLERGWDKAKGESRLGWEKAKLATRDAWERTKSRLDVYDSEDRYWRESWQGRDYVDPTLGYETYRPAYEYGAQTRERYPDRQWDDLEADARRGWEATKANTRLGWDKARDAIRDGWHHVENRLPGDFDRDGR